jgi:AcrR family transcriptional regulator
MLTLSDVTPRTPTRRTQEQRRANSERLLMAAATELIAQRGIEGTSLASIGELAGTSRGLANHHFQSKGALVERVAQQAQNDITAAMAAALARAQRKVTDAPALEILRMLVTTYLALFEDSTPEYRALIVLWGETFPSEASVDGILEADCRSYDGWSQLIARGQRDGSIRDEIDPDATAVVLHGLLRGLAAVLLTDGGADPSSVRTTCDLWIEAALAPTTR